MEETATTRNKTEMMAGIPNHRHRLGVVPGLSGSSTTSMPPVTSPSGLRSPLPALDTNNNQQVVPFAPGHASKQMATWHGHGANSEFRSSGRGEASYSPSQMHNIANRIRVIEEANKAILEEVYRLQSSVRSSQMTKKGNLAEEKMMQKQIMETIRGSNDVVSELTSRMRRAEEKLHIDKETRKNIQAQTKQFEQALLNSQQEYNSQRDSMKALYGEMRHRLDETIRKYERSDRTSTSLVDEFRQMKTKLEMQAMDFTHLQTEVRQRSKRLEEDTKQAMLETKYQKENNSQAEQNSLQTRQFFEVRINELRDVITDMRNRIGRAESESHSLTQQTSMRLAEINSSLNDQSHKRQEDLQAIERHQQEQGHIEESERFKLQTRIKEAVEEMSDKLLGKEVRLREEAMQKFLEVERQVQKEESSRVVFEKQMREDNDKRWNLQQKVVQDELQAMKEVRRTERTKQEANSKRVEEAIHLLDKKLQREKKNLEKVLLAEITKREAQSSNITSQVDAVHEQLRVALSSLQQAIGGVQFQVSRDKEQFTNEIKTKISEERQRVSRAITDADTRLTALAARITQQDETYDTKLNEVESVLRDQHTDMLRNTQEWKENINKDIENLRDVLKDLPQELHETQERVEGLKQDAVVRQELENEARRRDTDAADSKIRMLAQRTEALDVFGRDDHSRIDELQQQLATANGTLNQLTRTITDMRTSQNVRLNSETKMRLEESSAIKIEQARLRMDIQPLLWQQSTESRRFVKKGSTGLNEWGLYQCARWYDIKMRWLRMLDRGKRRRGRAPIVKEESQVPSSLDENEDVPSPSAGYDTSVHEGRQAWESQPHTPAPSDQDGRMLPSPQQSNGAGSESGLHGQPEGESLGPENIGLGHPESVDEHYQEDEETDKAWYNQDTVPTDFQGEERGTPVSGPPSRRESAPPTPSQTGHVEQTNPTHERSPRGTPLSRTSPKPASNRPSPAPTPPRSRTGSKQNIQRANSRQTPPTATNSKQQTPPTSKPSSGARGNREAPSRGSAPRNGNDSRRQSAARNPENGRNGGYDLEGERA